MKGIVWCDSTRSLVDTIFLNSISWLLINDSAHAYTILDAAEVPDGENVIQLLQLRNPWGHGEWLGAWSDRDAAWSKPVRSLTAFFNVVQFSARKLNYRKVKLSLQ